MKSHMESLKKPQLSSDSPLSWAVFISGFGSNLQALIDADPKIRIELVVSSRAEAPGLERAKVAGIPTLILPKSIDWIELSTTLTRLNIDRIFLAGFMKVVPSLFISDWTNRILNLHPSLLPAYKGLGAIERSYKDNASMGVTVHWVTQDLDAGPILLQKEVLAAGRAQDFPFDTVKELIHKTENQIVVDAVRRCQEC